MTKGSVKLDCDGYRLTLCRARKSEMTDCNMFNVNGAIRNSWMLEDCEERRRFFRPRKAFIWSRKARDTFMKMRKGTLNSMGIDAEARVTYYEPYWPGFQSLKAHLGRSALSD
jgi:hypothetical protein